MTLEQAKSELMQIYGALSPDKQRAIDTLVKIEPKIGHWISHYDEGEKVGWYECDRCHTERAFNTKFCPDCGAKMESEVEG